jgi:type 1 fimbria pilin
MSVRLVKRHSWHVRVLRLLALSLLLLGAQQAWATRCWYDSNNSVYGNGAGNVTMPLLVGNLTAGRDLPIGSVLYRQTFRINGSVSIGCKPGTTPLTIQRKFASTPLPLANWNSSPFAGSVYQTGVPGIGIAVWYGEGRYPFPYTSTGGNCTSILLLDCYTTVQSYLDFDISLIKIGEIGTGTINGSQFPTVTLSLLAENTLPLVNVSFSGSINLTAQTCQTPNVNVDLGSHALKDMATVGSGSDWKSFNIALNNCPAFRGTYTNAEGGVIFNSGGTNSTPGPSRANSIQFQLDPATSVVDTANGVIGLAGTNTATGVGIQIARGGSTTGIQYGTLLPGNLTLSTTATGNYTIPLQARYYRTQSAATPGSGNASVTFTINYQ